MSCKKKCNNKYANIDFDFGIPNRFDLECAITHQMDIADNLNAIIEDVVDGDGLNLDQDELVNTLQGILNLHTMKYNKLWYTFINLFRLDGSVGGLYNDFNDSDDLEDEDEND
jgi:hypothetical protein